MTTSTRPDWDSPEYKKAVATCLRWDEERNEPYLQLPSHPDLRITPFREGIEDEIVTLFNHPVIGVRLYTLPYPMSKQYADDWVAKDIPKWRSICADIKASTTLPTSDFPTTPLTPTPGSAPINGMPFKSIRSVSTGKIVGDCMLGVSKEVPSGEPMTEEEALAKPRAEQKWELGYVLDPAAHGRGVMAEAIACILEGFAKPFIRPGAIAAWVAVDNAGSTKVVLKNGLVKLFEEDSKWPEEKGGGIQRAAYFERKLLQEP